jgi:hypothetical protein
MLIQGDHWIPQIGYGRPTKSLKSYRKSQLIRDRSEMEKFVNKLGFTVDEVERLIGKAIFKLSKLLEKGTPKEQVII